MPSLNRFDTYVPLRSNFVPKEYIPNFEGLAKALQAQEQRYDLAQQASDIPVDGLQGKDLEYAEELRKQRYASIDKASKIFQEQGLNAGNRYLNDLVRQIRREELPGGASFDLKQRKSNFLDFQQKQQERLQKDEISRAQYQRSVSDALEAYNQAGGYRGDAALSLTGRPNQIIYEDFALKHLDAMKASGKIDEGWMYRNGRVFHRERKVTELEAQKIQDAIAESFKNAAARTGQLADEFDVRYKGQEFNKDAFIQKGEDQKQKALELKTYIDAVDINIPRQVKLLQQELQKYGLDTGGTDGVAGPKTLAAINDAKQATQASIQQADAYLQRLDDLDARSLYMNQFITDEVNRLARPTGILGSYRDEDLTLTSFGKTLDRVRAEKLAEQEAMFPVNTQDLPGDLSGINELSGIKYEDGKFKWTDDSKAKKFLKEYEDDVARNEKIVDKFGNPWYLRQVLNSYEGFRSAVVKPMIEWLGTEYKEGIPEGSIVEKNITNRIQSNRKASGQPELEGEALDRAISNYVNYAADNWSRAGQFSPVASESQQKDMEQRLLNISKLPAGKGKIDATRGLIGNRKVMMKDEDGKMTQVNPKDLHKFFRDDSVPNYKGQVRANNTQLPNGTDVMGATTPEGWFADQEQVELYVYPPQSQWATVDGIEHSLNLARMNPMTVTTSEFPNGIPHAQTQNLGTEAQTFFGKGGQYLFSDNGEQTDVYWHPQGNFTDLNDKEIVKLTINTNE